MKKIYAFFIFEWLTMFAIAAISWEACKFDGLMVMGFFSLVCLTGTCICFANALEQKKENKKGKEDK